MFGVDTSQVASLFVYNLSNGVDFSKPPSACLVGSATEVNANMGYICRTFTRIGLPTPGGGAASATKKKMVACGLKVEGGAKAIKTWAADAIPEAMYLYERGTNKVIITGKEIVDWGLVPEKERDNTIDWSEHVSTYNATTSAGREVKVRITVNSEAGETRKAQLSDGREVKVRITVNSEAGEIRKVQV